MIHKTAVILCGGKGTRLGSLGKKIPKSLVKVHKYPIIWYIVNALHYHSINHFIMLSKPYLIPKGGLWLQALVKVVI